MANMFPSFLPKKDLKQWKSFCLVAYLYVLKSVNISRIITTTKINIEHQIILKSKYDINCACSFHFSRKLRLDFVYFFANNVHGTFNQYISWSLIFEKPLQVSNKRIQIRIYVQQVVHLIGFVFERAKDAIPGNYTGWGRVAGEGRIRLIITLKPLTFDLMKESLNVPFQKGLISQKAS
jgi:hypothetical protein